MTYAKQTWNDDAAGGTPLSAPRLNHMEAGIESAHQQYDETFGAADAALVSANESTASTTYGNLTTPGPQVTVTIGASGRCLVMLSAAMRNDTAGGRCVMSFSAAGPTPLSASDPRALAATSSDANDQFWIGRTVLVSGLLPGAYTFTAQYRRGTTGGGNANFANRTLVVLPL